MNQFPYENLSDGEFEELVIRIAKELLGVGCKTFSVGKDGAKDSWFTGTAEKFPSKAAPWSGSFNLQAKHTRTANASCADNDFYVNKSSIVVKEIERLKEIQKDTPFDCYILFTNRKLPGTVHQLIVKKLNDGLGISNVEVIGREQLDTYLTDFSFIAEQFGLYQFIAPLRFYEKDLREVVVIFSEQSQTISNKATEYILNYDIVAKEEKNKLNGLSKDYFDFILKHSNQYFKDIEEFLIDPRNDKYTRMYSNTVSDLQARILLERNRFSEFQFLIEHLIDFVVERNQDKLKDIRSLVRVFIHFMYFNCDIGKTK